MPFEVGWGIVSPTGGTLLFNAGENGKGNSVIIPYLQTYGLAALDFIVAYPYHPDILAIQFLKHLDMLTLQDQFRKEF